MSLRLRVGPKLNTDLNPSKDMNENGIVVQRGLILSYLIALLKADLGVQAVGRVR